MPLGVLEQVAGLCLLTLTLVDDDPAGRLLEAVHLAREALERLAQHAGVAEDEVDGPERDRAGPVERGAQAERCAGAER